MDADLMAVARRHLAAARPGNEVKGQKPAPGADFPPLTSIPSVPPAVPQVPSGWGCLEEPARRLVVEAEEYLALAEVSGADPVIQAAAEVVFSAWQTCDFETLRFSVGEFRAAVSSVLVARARARYARSQGNDNGG